MVTNSNGTIISGIVQAAYSVLGDEYIAILDDMGATIHIKRSIVEYLSTIPRQSSPQQIVDTKNLFI